MCADVADVQQSYGARVPAFAADARQLPYLDLEEYHLTQQALRRLIRRMRKELQKSDAYHGSKLEQLDEYEVKLTELSTFPIVLRPGIHVPTETQKAAWDNKNAAKQPKAKKKKGRPRKSSK